jgi:hypothetical protein
MEDSAKPSASEGYFPSTELTDRLLRRAQEPLGVIDTRPAEQIHARTASWVAGKLDLLERYATRYGIVEAVPQVTPTALLRSESTWPIESAADVTSAEQHSRVMAEPWPASATGKVPLPEQDQVRQAGQDSDRSESVVSQIGASASPVSSQPSPQVKEIPGPTSSSPVNLHLRRNHVEAIPSRADGVTHGPLTPSATSSPAGTMAAAPDSQKIKPGNASSAMFESPPPVAESKPLPLVRERKPSAPQPILQRRQAEVPNPVTGNVPETLHGGSAGDVSAHPEARQTTDGSRTAQSTSPALVVRETYPAKAPAQSASLIFRNRDGRGPATGLDSSQNRSLLSGSMRAQAPPVLREPTNTLSSGSTELSLIGGPAAQSGSGGIDVAEVAEQVSRMIARQLVVDRERRGRTR